MNAFYHARSSARKWGGEPPDYLPLHEFIDSSKESWPDMRHRAMLHSSWGIYLAAKVFGPALSVSRRHGCVQVPTRLIAEQHVMEDLGRIPTLGDYLQHMALQPWMSGATTRHVSVTNFLEGP